MVTLYRGIAAKLDNYTSIQEETKQVGIPDDFVGKQSYSWHRAADIKSRSLDLLSSPQRIRTVLSETPSFPITYACGDIEGAWCYAREGDIPVTIELEQDEQHLAVDGRDFLHTVFQLWDNKGDANRRFVAESLAKVYGPEILRYFDTASSQDKRDHESRLGIADVACFDADIVRAHLKNKVMIHGRFGRVFRSAFSLPLPVKPSQIIEVHVGAMSRLVEPYEHLHLTNLIS